MIYIKKNQLNKVVLTLDESSSLLTPYYLFQFKNEYQINSPFIYWTTDDLSGSQNRYNLFNLIESSTGSTSGGTNVALSLIPGQYEYRVYESTGSTIQLSATTGRIIEEGRMVVAAETITTTKSIYR
jgi:hypothetical protein